MLYANVQPAAQGGGDRAMLERVVPLHAGIVQGHCRSVLLRSAPEAPIDSARFPSSGHHPRTVIFCGLTCDDRGWRVICHESNSKEERKGAAGAHG